MNITTLLILVSLSIFAAYNIYILISFGVPENISITYYHLEQKRRGLGLLFPAMVVISCTTMLITWLDIEQILDDNFRSYHFLIMITALSTFFVAALSNYKRSRLQTIIHYTAAIIASIAGLAWILIADFHMLYIPLITLLLVALAAWLTNTYKHQILFWLELIAIYSIQIALFILSITL